MRPKYKTGEPVIVRAPTLTANNAEVVEARFFKKGMLVTRHGVRDVLVDEDIWGYRVDISNDFIRESFVFPHQDPSPESFNEMITAFKSFKPLREPVQ